MSTRETAQRALDELRRTGTTGDAFGELLYAVARAVARFGPFPPPEGRERWSPDEISELAHRFLADDNTPRRLATLAVTSADGGSLAAQLEEALKNFLRDEGRMTDRGHLLRRVRSILDDDPRFVAEGTGTARRWRLGEEADVGSSATMRELVRAAYVVDDVAAVAWTGRRGPIAVREGLVRILEAVLAEAGGSVSEGDLADVIDTRFGVATNATVVSLEDVPYTDVADATFKAPEERDHTAVRELWAQLTLRDRVILAHVELTDRQLGPVLGLGKSAAGAARERLGQSLQASLGGDPDGESTYERLVDVARRWFAHRTDPSSIPFSHDDTTS